MKNNNASENEGKHIYKDIPILQIIIFPFYCAIAIFIIIASSIQLMNNNVIKRKVINGDFEKIQVLHSKENISDNSTSQTSNYNIVSSILVSIFCEYPKHKKYDEWLKKWESNTDESERNNVFRMNTYMSDLAIVSLKSLMPNAIRTSYLGSTLYFTYFYDFKSNSEITFKEASDILDKKIDEFFKMEDCKSIIELSKEAYVSLIRIEIGCSNGGTDI